MRSRLPPPPELPVGEPLLPGSLTVPPVPGEPLEEVAVPPEPEPPLDPELTCCRQDAEAARAVICVRLQEEN